MHSPYQQRVAIIKKLITSITAVSLTGAASLLAVPAHAATPQLHAEDMRNGGGKYVVWTTQDGPTVRSLLSNGSAIGSITAPTPFEEVEITAAGHYSRSTVPTVRVFVDGERAGDIALVSKTLETYSLEGSWSAGQHDIRIEYLNDVGQNSAVIDHVAIRESAVVAPPAPVQPAPAPTPSPDPPVAAPWTGQRDYSLHPFSSDAFSNTPVGPAVRFAAANDPRNVNFREGSTGVGSERWSISVQQAASTDPEATLRANGKTYKLRIPVNAATTGGTDQHMTVIQPDKRTAHEMWGMQRISSTQWTARYLVETDLHGEGMEAGARASGISQLHGLIRKDELANLKIDHSLAIGVSNDKLRRSPVWPAQAEDGDSSWAYKGNIPMGSMFALPRSVDVNTLDLTPEGLALAKALQNYGAHILVRSGGTNLFAEPAADQGQVQNLRKDWATLRPLLQLVTNNTEDNVAGAR